MMMMKSFIWEKLFMNDENDFGFSAVDDEFISSEFDNRDKAKEMYDAIYPLLTNLKKDSDKSKYILWPERAKKIDQFIDRLQNILNGENT